MRLGRKTAQKQNARIPRQERLKRVPLCTLTHPIPKVTSFPGTFLSAQVLLLSLVTGRWERNTPCNAPTVPVLGTIGEVEGLEGWGIVSIFGKNIDGIWKLLS